MITKTKEQIFADLSFFIENCHCDEKLKEMLYDAISGDDYDVLYIKHNIEQWTKDWNNNY